MNKKMKNVICCGSIMLLSAISTSVFAADTGYAPNPKVTIKGVFSTKNKEAVFSWAGVQGPTDTVDRSSGFAGYINHNSATTGFILFNKNLKKGFKSPAKDGCPLNSICGQVGYTLDAGGMYCVAVFPYNYVTKSFGSPSLALSTDPSRCGQITKTGNNTFVWKES